MKTANKEKANGYITNRTHLGRRELPPIRRKYDIEENPQVQDFVDDKFPFSLPRLPQIERCPLVETKIHSTFQKSEGKHKSFNSYLTIGEKCASSRLRRAEALKSKVGRMKQLEMLNRKEIFSLSSETCREDGLCRAVQGELSKNCMVELKPAVEKVYLPKKEIAPIAKNALRRPVHLLRRRLKPGSAYRHSHGQMSHEELLAFDQNMDQLRAFTGREEKMEVKDFNGTKIDPNKTGNGDITSYMGLFEQENAARSSSHESRFAPTIKRPENCVKSPSKKETKVRVESRFFEALDLHFYHYYRNTHPGRRMAICEEIERSIFVENIALSSYRDNLRLQDVLDSWML